MAIRDRLKRRFEELFAIADIRIDGDRPWDIHIHDDRFYARCFSNIGLGLGESYVDGWWDCERLDDMFVRAGRAKLQRHIRPSDAANVLLAKFAHRLPRTDASHFGRDHYEFGTEFYRRLFGERMLYSSGYWQDVDTLDQAQERKLDLIARKLGFAPGMRVLDIGCGWGGTLRYFAETYGITGVGVTLSEDQHREGQRACADLPIEIRRLDYADLDDKFDRIYSIEMIGHLQPKQYQGFMRKVASSLNPEGMFLLQSMGCDRSDIKTDPWIKTYIYPGSQLPTAARLAKASEDHLIHEDWHCLSQDCERTFAAWRSNLALASDELSDRLDPRIFRVWGYFLNACIGGFRSRINQMWQIVYSSPGDDSLDSFVARIPR